MGPEVVDVSRLENQMVELVMGSLRRRRDVLGLESWIFVENCGWRKGVWAVSLGSRLGESARSRIEFAGGELADVRLVFRLEMSVAVVKGELVFER